MQTDALWPFAVYSAAVLIVAAVMVGVSSLLGERHRDPHTGVPFESGILPTGTARLRFDIKFYLVAMFFVIFDLEAVFLFAWAVAVRELGWAGYLSALVFIALLAAALVYLWRLGALDWGTLRRKRQTLR